MREANIPPFNDKSKIRTRNHLSSSHVDPQKHFPKKPPKLDAEKLQSEETMSHLHVCFIPEFRLTTPSRAKLLKNPFVLCVKSTSFVH